MTQDLRQHSRVPLPIRIQIGGAHFLATDWSVGGFRLEASHHLFSVGQVTQASVAFHLVGSDITLDLTTKVVWNVGGTTYGLRLVDVPDTDATIIDSLVNRYLSGDLTGRADAARAAQSGVAGH